MFQVPVSGASRCWRVGVQIRSWTWRRSGARAGNGLNWIWVWSSYLKNNHIRGVMRRNVPPPSWQLVTHLERFITHILISSPFKWETESVTVSVGRIIRWMILVYPETRRVMLSNWFRKLRYKSVILMCRVYFLNCSLSDERLQINQMKLCRNGSDVGTENMWTKWWERWAHCRRWRRCRWGWGNKIKLRNCSSSRLTEGLWERWFPPAWFYPPASCRHVKRSCWNERNIMEINL